MEKFIFILLMFAYGWGMWKFSSGFGHTRYGQNRIVLTLLWPVLFIASKAFRENFQKALRG
jgi:hypothetical protein